MEQIVKRRRSHRGAVRSAAVAGLWLIGCTPSPATTQTEAPPAAAPSSQVFVAFDTTATCKAKIAQGPGWVDLDVNALVTAPATLGGQQGSATSVTHPALGNAWVDLSTAASCVIPQWSPGQIPLDPAAPVYLRLGEPGCEQLDPILGSARDIDDSGYTITSVLPALASADGGAPAVLDIVRLSSGDGAHRLTIARDDLARCVSASPREPSPSDVRPKPTPLPQGGRFGPSPIVLGTKRIAGPATRPEWSPVLSGVERPLRKWVLNGLGSAWRPEGRAVALTQDGVAVQVSARWTDIVGEPGNAASAASDEPTSFTNPKHQVLSAAEGASRVAAAWATLEGRYPAAGNTAYVEAANARARRTASELESVPGTVAGSEVLALPAAASRLRKIDAVIDVDPPAGGPPAFSLVASTTIAALAQRRVNTKKSGGFGRSTATQLRRWLDVAASLQPLAAQRSAAALSIEGDAAGLAVTAMDTVAQRPVALVSGFVEQRSGVLRQPAIDIALTPLPGAHCHVLAAESLAPGDSASIEISIGILREDTFTPIAVDHRGSPRAGVEACWLPDDPGLVFRVETDAPFVAGLFATGDDITVGHLLGAMNTTLRRPRGEEPFALDGAVGLPDPADIEESVARALRYRNAATEEAR